MDNINPTILKTTIEAIPILTEDNFTIWRTRITTLLNFAQLKDAIGSDSESLSPTDNSILTLILISKLSSPVHTNLITAQNKESAKEIWKAILKHFVSSKPLNWDRVYSQFSSISFDENNIQSFITEVKTGVNKLHKICIVLPVDILTYMILDKLLDSMRNIKQQITHSNFQSKINPNAVLDHLRIHMNEKRMNNGTSSGSQQLASLFTDASGKCKPKKNNTMANHPKHKCWMLYPHLRPKNPTQPVPQDSETYQKEWSVLAAVRINLK